MMKSEYENGGGGHKTGDMDVRDGESHGHEQ